MASSRKLALRPELTFFREESRMSSINSAVPTIHPRDIMKPLESELY